MSTSKVYQNDVGTVFQVDVGTDLSSATTIELKVQKPSGTVDTWTAAKNGTTDTQIDYTVVTGDLDERGAYKLQAYVVTPVWSGRGETAHFRVYETFQ